MAVLFSTRDVDPSERLACWRDTMSSVRHDFDSSAGGAFLGSVQIDRLGEIEIKDFDCDPCEVRRTPQHIGMSDTDDFILCMPSRGRAVYFQDDRQAVAQVGGFVLIDASRPYTIHYQGAPKSVSFYLPRRALTARIGEPVALVTHAMDVRQPIVGVASSFLSMLSARVGAVDPITGARLAEQVLDMIALVYSLEGQGSQLTLSSPRETSLLRLKTLIERRLHDPGLKPAEAAAAAGISVRYANELLSGESTSLERYILKRRLDRCRRALADPGHNHRQIGELAFAQGFSNHSHFARRFRDAYGLSPTDYRERAQVGLAEAG
jgi:AraC family transcriptional regulator, positive regulator of tynA and feaB